MALHDLFAQLYNRVNCASDVVLGHCGGSETTGSHEPNCTNEGSVNGRCADNSVHSMCSAQFTTC